MPDNHRRYVNNPLIQEDPQDTLLHSAAVLYCLQHLDVKTGLDDEGELGLNLILETVRLALRYEALERHVSNPAD